MPYNQIIGNPLVYINFWKIYFSLSKLIIILYLYSKGDIMQWFINMKLKYKLFIFVIFLTCFTSCVGFLSYKISLHITENMQKMYNFRIVPMYNLNSYRTINKTAEAIVLTILFTPLNKTEQYNLLAKLTEQKQIMNDLLKEYEITVIDDIEKEWLNRLKNETKLYFNELEKALDELVINDNQELAKQYYQTQTIIHRDNSDALLHIMSNHSKELAAQENLKTLQLATKSSRIIAKITFVSILLALILGWLLSFYLSHPLKIMLGEVEKVAAGDFSRLSNHLPVNSNDEVGKLANGFNKMTKTLNKYMQELEDKNSQIFFQANHDALTSLPNRRLFNTHLEKLLLTKNKMAIFFIDLDHFKDINDTLGHRTGDILLKEVAKRLLNLLSHNYFLSRLGGDEFTIIIPDLLNLDEAKAMAKNIINCLDFPFEILNHKFQITSSIGISIFPDNGNDLDSLLSSADTAMYYAKRGGRNNYQLYSNDMRSNIKGRLELEQLLRNAVQQNEFELVFQPKMNIISQKITGMEALIRWNHPEIGAIPPSDFMPVAEEMGIINEIGLWVLKTACKQNIEWQNKGFPHLPVAVNISPRQFYNNDLASDIKQILEETSLKPCWLEIEITEGALMDNTEKNQNTLKKLKEIGIKINIDDFGTGYSSLNYLCKFPINTLKIDKSFIQGINLNSKNCEIIRAISSLATILDFKVIAEGVETEEQLSFLKQLNCHEIQGYLLSKPLTAQSFKNKFLFDETL